MLIGTNSDDVFSKFKCLTSCLLRDLSKGSKENETGGEEQHLSTLLQKKADENSWPNQNHF